MSKAYVIDNSEILSADTIVHLLVDKSGSMSAIREKTVDAINEYMNSLKKDNVKDKTLINLSFFSKTFGSKNPYGNLNIENVCKVTPLERFEDIRLEDFAPDGGTPLYDAIGKASKEIDEVVASCKERPDILFIIVTDGMENASQEYKQDTIRSLLNSKEESGWTVVYLGANQDAWAVGGGMGLSQANTMSYSAHDIGSTMGTLAAATSSYRSAKYASKVKDATKGYTSSNFFNEGS